MGQSNAERQRRWRQRQRETKRKEYLTKERMRKRGRYVPTKELSRDEQEKRRQKCRNDFRKHYQKVKEMKAAYQEAKEDQSCRRPNLRKDGLLKVKMPFAAESQKGSGARKRYSRALRKTYRDLAILKSKCNDLQKQKKRLQKKIERQSMSTSTSSAAQEYSTEEDIGNEPTTSTPRSRSKFMLAKFGINVKRNSVVYRRLVLGNALVDSLKYHKGKKKSNHGMYDRVGTSIVKKYRCMTQVSKEIGVSRRKISNLILPRARKSIKEKYGDQVRIFLEREDNSTILPGKRDAIRKGDKATQKRVLNDYLHNLHQKFLIENPETNLSRSSFSSLRTPNMVLTCFSSRKTCLCTYHQNFSLKIKAMQREGLKSSSSPDAFIKEFNTSKLLQEQLSETCKNDQVSYRMWKKVPDGDKVRWKEVELTVERDEFIKTVVTEHDKFSAHVKRVQNQYSEMRKLRENLPMTDVLIWMDFAENFGCSSVEEVQSAYWNAQMVSLHTMVVYFPKVHDKPIQSYVAISESLSHNASAVYTILKKLVPQVKAEFPQLKQIHYLTDSPSSQYRNKSIFQVVCEHEQEFGVKARWNYLETGHGKGPCDGLGASVKRAADMAVKQQKCLIQDAGDFFEWTKREDSQSKVKFVKYTEGEIEESANDLKGKDPVSTVTGTMKIHAVAPVHRDTIAIRDLSCYCNDCLVNVTQSKCGWTLKTFVKSVERRKEQNVPQKNTSTGDNSASSHTELQDPEVMEEKNREVVEFKTGNWVAACYDNRWYIGLVTEIETESGECQISFLEKSSKCTDTYKFPLRKDEIWIHYSDVLTVLEEFKPIGKTKRSYKLTDKDKMLIDQRFDDWLNG